MTAPLVKMAMPMLTMVMSSGVDLRNWRTPAWYVSAPTQTTSVNATAAARPNGQCAAKPDAVASPASITHSPCAKLTAPVLR
jgi:hypothetical protein